MDHQTGRCLNCILLQCRCWNGNECRETCTAWPVRWPGYIDRTHSLIKELVPKTISLDPAMLGRCNTGFDIAAMQHERLYSRLYMS
jgi:hypothetical protein